MYHIQKYLGVLTLSGLIALISLLTFYIFGPLGSDAYQNLIGQVTQYRTYQLAQSQFDLADSLKRLESASQKSKALLAAVPSDGRSSYILNQLLNGAEQYGLTIGGINALDEVAYTGYVELPFSLSLKGRFRPFNQYMAHLENMDMVIKVRQYLIQSPQLNQNQIEAEVSLSAYVLLQ